MKAAKKMWWYQILLISSCICPIVLAGQATGSTILATPSEIKLNTATLKFIPKLDKLSTSILYRDNYLQYYHQELGMFCKMDNQMDMTTPIQVRFRLGNLDYVNKLENK